MSAISPRELIDASMAYLRALDVSKRAGISANTISAHDDDTTNILSGSFETLIRTMTDPAASRRPSPEPATSRQVMPGKDLINLVTAMGAAKSRKMPWAPGGWPLIPIGHSGRSDGSSHGQDAGTMGKIHHSYRKAETFHPVAIAHAQGIAAGKLSAAMPPPCPWSIYNYEACQAWFAGYSLAALTKMGRYLHPR